MVIFIYNYNIYRHRAFLICDWSGDSMKKFKRKLNSDANKTPIPSESNEEAVDIYSMEVAVERVEHGLIGTLRIEDNINSPIFKTGDFVHLRAPSRLLIRDFVLYHSHDEYFLRRIIKYKEEDIYVAGDNEKEYHIIRREDIVGKVISRQRKTKRLSFSLTPKKKVYTFRKVNLAYFRLKNRVIDYEQETNNESLELAIQSLAENKTVFENKTEIKYDIDLDSDLQSFLNPDTLVQELRDAMRESEQPEAPDSVVQDEDLKDTEDEVNTEENEGSA